MKNNIIILYTFPIFLTNGNLLRDGSNPSNGLGDQIIWRSWSGALEIGKELGKPIMVVLHKSWCPTCKSFKPVFANSEVIHKMSTHFIMVNVQEEQEPINESKLNVDGNYVPRIIFLDSQSNVLKDAVNKHGNPNYKYYHIKAETVVDAMRSALEITSVAVNSTGARFTEF